MGSDSDWPVMEPAALALEEFDVPYEAHVLSAHRTPRRMLDYAEAAAGRGLRVIIAGAGGAAHLPGMVAAATPAAGHRRPAAAGPARRAGQPALDRADARRRAGGDRRHRRRPQRRAARRPHPRAPSDERLRAAVERFQADLAESVVARDAALQESLATDE